MVDIRTRMWRTAIKLVVYGSALALLVGIVTGLQYTNLAQASTTWNDGDIFLGVGFDSYAVYDSGGNFKQTISNGIKSSSIIDATTGCAFNPQKTQLYTTAWLQGKVVVFNNADPHAVTATIDTSAVYHDGFPESIVFNGNGEFYVGLSSNPGSPPGNRLVRYGPNNTLEQGFSPEIDQRGVDWVELSHDGKTIFYTSEGRRVMRYDVSGSGRQLADFTPPGGLPGDPHHGQKLFALRLLPPGDGSGGLLVADNNDILQLDGSGKVTKTYDAPGVNSWFGLNLDADGKHFWSASASTEGTDEDQAIAGNSADASGIYEFDIGGSEAPIKHISLNTDRLGGICIRGELTAPPTAPPPPPPTPGPKLYFDGDAWIGNRSVTVNDHIGIGYNALVVAGGTVSSGNWPNVARYNDPQGGKTDWDTVENQLIGRVRQTYIATNNQLPENEQTCPGGVYHIQNLYLQWGRDIYTGQPLPNATPEHPPDTRFVLFQFNDKLSSGQTCHYIIDSSTVIHGTGTIISTNRQALLQWRPGQKLPGATIEIRGTPQLNAHNTLGIINFGDALAKSNPGYVEIDGGVSVANLAIYSSELRLDANRTAKREVLNMAAAARHVVFPPAGDLKSDMIIEHAPDLNSNVPPLFETLILPTGRETP